MNTTRKAGLIATGLAAALGLAGCFGGGGGGDDVPVTGATPTEVPDSAAASSAAFIGYLLPLSGSDEAAEPSTIKSSFDVPADETSEPQLLT